MSNLARRTSRTLTTLALVACSLIAVAQESVLAEKAAIRDFFQRLKSAVDAGVIDNPDELQKSLGIELFGWDEFVVLDSQHWRTAQVRTHVAYFDDEPKRASIRYRLRRENGSLYADLAIDVRCKSPFTAMGQLGEMLTTCEADPHPHGFGSTTCSYASASSASLQVTYLRECESSVRASQFRNGTPDK